MKNRSSVLLGALAVACLLAGCPRPAEAYIKVEPLPLGSLCRMSGHIYVLRVETVSAEKGVILFKAVEQLKGEPDGTVRKHVINPDVKGAKVILDWAAEGKTAVIFCNTEKTGKAGQESVYGRGHAYIDGYWYWMTYDGSNWIAGAGEPTWLTQYCGTADKLRDALAKILLGEEVVVPGMVNDNKEDLEQRRARVQDLRASLKIGNDDPKGNSGGDKKPGDKKPDPGDVKPDDKKPVGKQPEDRKPDRVGTVKALSADGKSFTLLPASTEKNKEPGAIDIQIGENARITSGKEAGKVAVGQTVSVWFGKGAANVAVEIQVGKRPEPPVRKPEPGDKKPVPDANEKKPEASKKPEPGDKKPDNKKEK